MIDMASRAPTNGVKIPGRKRTRAAIKQLYKDHLTNVKAKLNVSMECHERLLSHLVQGPTVTGEVNLTCDAWQADNKDGYFAVTAHWIEEKVVTQWTLETSIIGFTRLNNAHNGERLGQALFKIVDRVGITHKVNLLYLVDSSANEFLCRLDMLRVIMRQIM